MAWIKKYARVWRIVLLGLMLVAFLGPWTFDLIWVPSDHFCYALYIRLDDDYCGIPLSGIWQYRWVTGIFIFGVAKLLKAARLEGLLTDRKTIALIIFVAFGLPLMFIFPIFNSRRYAPTNMPFGLFYENNVPDILVYGLGTLWLFLDGWLISRLKVSKQSNHIQVETV
jgi:hypothetical protein